jgi:hypothetical protein
MGYFPLRLLSPILDMDLTSRKTFELVIPVLIEAGLQEVCSGLINFLTVYLVLPAEDSEVPVTVWAQAGRVGYSPGPVAINYRRASCTGIYLVCAQLWDCNPLPAIPPWLMFLEACATW